MFSPNAIEVINFFTAETERGVGYRALCNARSALNSVCSIPGYPDISHHPLIKRFIKGWFNLKPPRSNITYTWDVNIVLQYLNNLGENANLSFPILCKKVVTLMMLLSGTRVNSLHTFNIKLMNLTSRDCTFIPDGVIKHTRPNYKQSGIIYHSYPHNPRLCPVQTIADYLVIRNNMITPTDKFFVISRKPWSAASRDTLARWLKDVMGEAGVNTHIFKPHSCRSASTSAASRHGVPLQDILKHGDWANSSTFYNFYKKDIHSIESDIFSSSILDKTVV